MMPQPLTEAIEASLDAFLDADRCDWPRLIYCKPDSSVVAEAACSGLRVCDFSEDIIPHLQKRTVYILDREWHTRGLDFAAKTENCGIMLLIAEPLSSLRAYHQCLCRVGRKGTPFERFILRGVDKFAVSYEDDLRSKISRKVKFSLDLTDTV